MLRRRGRGSGRRKHALQGLIVALVAAVQAGMVESRSYAYLSYGDIKSRIEDLEESFPTFVKVTTAQSRYGLPTFGKCGGGSNCKNFIVEVTNFDTLDQDPARPEVFFSGELHGDERVGPTATVEFVQVLMDMRESNPWVEHLVENRKIVIMPMANAKGYFDGSRREGTVDVNRDFPIETPSAGCMNSIAARSLNELFREHLFQLAITFHGGIEMILYTWGTQLTDNTNRNVSPDEFSQAMLGSSMSAYAGKLGGSRYPHGRINDLLYAVEGGMEDWAYAGSWGSASKHTTLNCDQGSYDSSRTLYGTDELRVLNFLVETSDDKTPDSASLGSDEGVLDPASSGNGHIPRNIRLMLFLTDMVQPYIHVVAADGVSKVFSWEVGGALFVDQTYIVYKFEKNGNVKTARTKVLKGKTRWSGGGLWKRSNKLNKKHAKGKSIALKPGLIDRDVKPFVGAFRTKINVPKGGILLEAKVLARVDQKWKQKAKGVFPKLSPQSHFVRARTQEEYFVEHNGRQIKGRLRWESDTMCFDNEGAPTTCIA